MNNGNYDLIIVDLPGTVNSSGVINTIVNMDYVITPIIPDRIVMQSSLSFSTIVWDYAKTSKEATNRYNKELSLTTRNFFRCTLFPPPAKSLKGSGLPELAEELLVKFKK